MKEFTHQIKRMTGDWYNYVEPSAMGNVTAVNVNMADIALNNGLTLPNVPVLQTGSSLTLNVNDTVLVIFVNGHVGNPVVVGKV
jgi:hypothetical protein